MVDPNRDKRLLFRGSPLVALNVNEKEIELKTAELKSICKEYAQQLIVELTEEESNAQVTEYLDFCSRFHRYSFSNRLLIWFHKPDSTFVAGFRTWQKMGRFVQKGEKGIPIFAPIKIRKKPNNETDSEDKENLFFRVVYVWDVSQTDGEALPEAPDYLKVEGDPGELLQTLEDVIADFGIRLETVDNLGRAAGVSMKGQVKVISSLEGNERFSILCHELAHELLHGPQERIGLSKKVMELEAEATAYVVCRRFNLKTNASIYLSFYKVEEVDVMESLNRIISTASKIICAVENRCNKLEKAA